MYIQLTDICYLCRRVLEMLACGLGDEGAKALAKNLPSCFLQGEVDPAERREALLDLRVNAFTNAGVSREEEESSFSVEESSFVYTNARQTSSGSTFTNRSFFSTETA